MFRNNNKTVEVPINLSKKINLENEKKRILSKELISRMPQGEENISRGINNEIIGDAGLAYNLKEKINGTQIVGGL